jgi:hypothetical protein
MPMLSCRVSVRPIACALCLVLTAASAAARQRTDFGTLSIQVRPPDAEIFIDGERWTAPEGPGPFQVQLSPGTHHVQLRSPGRQAFVREVTIRAGETTPLNVALTQSAPRTAPPPPTRTQAPQPTGSIARVTASEDGFVIAPDFRITEIDQQTAELIGAYGGYVFAGQVLIGGGAYWQANTTDGAHLAYGGPVVEWRLFTDRTIGFNLHGLVGAGWRYSGFGYFRDVRFGQHGGPGNVRYGMPYGWHDEVFFVAEPEAQIVVRFGRSVRLQGGVGYRATSADRLSGPSGSISLQFGR